VVVLVVVLVVVVRLMGTYFPTNQDQPTGFMNSILILPERFRLTDHRNPF
jgi:hypothetical protein